MTAVRLEHDGRDPVDIDALMAENAKLKDYLKRVLVTLEGKDEDTVRQAGAALMARIERELGPTALLRAAPDDPQNGRGERCPTTST